MSTEDDFNTFWGAFPRRVAKGHARTAFEKAIRKTTLETMLMAIADYIRFKPERIDFKHPATWLNGECWSDEWQDVPRETNRRRNFTDVAKDRFNGPAGISGVNGVPRQLPADEWQPGRHDEGVRVGIGRPFNARSH